MAKRRVVRWNWFRLSVQGGSSLRQRVVRAVSWSVIGTGFAQALFLGASIVAARILGVDDFGRFGLTYLTLNTLVNLISSSVGWSLMRMVAVMRDGDSRALRGIIRAVGSVGVLVSLIAGVALYATAPWISSALLNDYPMRQALQIVALAVSASGIFSLQTSLLVGFEAFRGSSLLTILRGVAMSVLTVLGAMWGGLNGAVWGVALSNLLVATVGWAVMRAFFSKLSVSESYNAEQTARWVLLHLSLPSFLYTVLGTVTPWVGSVLLANHTDGIRQVALLNIALHWKMVLLFLPTQINQSTGPILANLWGNAEHARLRALTRLNFLTNLAVGGTLCLLICAGAELILQAYQVSVPGGAVTIRLLAATGLISALYGVLGYIIGAMGRLWSALAINSVWATSFVSVAWLMLERGAVGIGIAYLVAQVLAFVAALAVVYSKPSKLSETA